MANVVEITVQGIDDATKVFERIDSQASKAMKNIESSISSIPDIDIDMDSSSLDGVEGEINQVEQKLKNLPDPDIDGSKAEQELKGIEDQASKTEDAVEGIDFGAIGGAVAGGATTSFLSDIEASASDLEAQFALTRAEAEKFRGIGKEVFASGYASSIGEASKAVTILNKQTGEQGKALQSLTQDVFSISDAYGEDFVSVINAARANSASMGVSFSQSLNTITAGFQNGLNISGDWMDTLTEFSPSFDRIGADGGEMIAMLQAGMQAGVRDTDRMADSINEFGILMQEVDNESLEKVAKSLTDTDAEAQKLVQTWQSDFAKGGDSASKVTEEVIQGLLDMEGQVGYMETAVGLFGTMWEDTNGQVGQAMLDSMGKTAELEGATSQLQEQYDTAGSSIQRFGRNILGGIIGPLEEAGPALNLGLQGITGISTALLAMKGLGVGSIFSSLGKWIGVATKATWGFTTALLANPMTWVVASILALIAVIVLLWKNWDEVSVFLVDTWNWIKEQASAIWNGLVLIFQTVWNFIKNIFTVVWAAIKTYLQSQWQAFIATAQTVWNTLKTFFTVLWNGIKAVAVTVWQAISSTVSAIVDGIVSFFKSSFNLAKTIITNVWNAIKSVSSSVWQGISNVLSSIIQGISSFFKGSFNTIKNFITNIWNGIRSVSTSLWSSISGAIKNIIRSIYSTISNIFRSIRNVISNVWSSIKSVSSSLWNGIKSTVTGIASGIKSSVSNVFNGIVSTISRIWNSVKSVTDNVWGSITGSIKGAINGVIGAINGMINAISSISITTPKIPDWVPKFGGKSMNIGFPNIPNIPYLAQGGVVDDETLAVIGEGRYDEAVIPLSNQVMDTLGAKIGSRIQVNSGDRNNQGYSNVDVSVNINYKELAKFIADALGEKLKPLIDSNKNTKMLVQNINLLIRVLIQSMGSGGNNIDTMELSRELQRLITRSKTSKGEGIG